MTEKTSSRRASVVVVRALVLMGLVFVAMILLIRVVPGGWLVLGVMLATMLIVVQAALALYPRPDEFEVHVTTRASAFVGSLVVFLAAVYGLLESLLDAPRLSMIWVVVVYLPIWLVAIAFQESRYSR